MLSLLLSLLFIIQPSQSETPTIIKADNGSSIYTWSDGRRFEKFVNKSTKFTSANGLSVFKNPESTPALSTPPIGSSATVNVVKSAAPLAAAAVVPPAVPPAAVVPPPAGSVRKLRASAVKTEGRPLDVAKIEEEEKKKKEKDEEKKRLAVAATAAAAKQKEEEERMKREEEEAAMHAKELADEVIKRGIVDSISPRHVDRLLKGGISGHTKPSTG